MFPSLSTSLNSSPSPSDYGHSMGLALCLFLALAAIDVIVGAVIGPLPPRTSLYA